MKRDKFGFVIEDTETPPPPKRQWIDSTGKQVMLAIGIGLPLAVAYGVWAAGNSDSTISADVHVQDVRHEVINPSAIKVVWTVEGEAGGTANCWVKASDPSGTYDGRDYVYDVELATGTRTAWIPLSIDNEGAAWVTDVEVDCS